MREAENISESIKTNFSSLTDREYRPGSAIGFFTTAVSREMENAYQEIEDAKNPHIYTNLSGENLDKMGYFVNVPRLEDEDDDNYLYRIMNWTYLKAASNYTAVNDSLLKLEYASDAKYYPGVYGAGTGVIYVIPKEYTEDIMEKALNEAKNRVENVISPESYTEFIIPQAVSVVVIAHIESENGDVEYLKDAIAEQAKEYINAIAPNDTLKVGDLNRIGNNMEGVDFFSVDGLYINDKYTSSTKIMQELETKMLFQEISWED